MTDPAAQPDRSAEFRAGVRAILPLIGGLVPFALVLGALAARKDLTALETGLMSAFVFAGSAQFAAIELWAAPPAIGALTLTAFLINLRHVVMGIALAPHLAGFGQAGRVAAAFWMADEIWALAVRRGVAGTLTPAYYVGLAFVFWSSWIVFTVTGAIVGVLIEDPVRWGFDFAFVAVFMGLVKGFWRGPSSLYVWAASAGAAYLVWVLVDGPWYVIAGALSGMAAALVAPDADERP